MRSVLSSLPDHFVPFQYLKRLKTCQQENLMGCAHDTRGGVEFLGSSLGSDRIWLWAEIGWVGSLTGWPCGISSAYVSEEPEAHGKAQSWSSWLGRFPVDGSMTAVVVFVWDTRQGCWSGYEGRGALIHCCWQLSLPNTVSLMVSFGCSQSGNGSSRWGRILWGEGGGLP